MNEALRGLVEAARAHRWQLVIVADPGGKTHCSLQSIHGTAFVVGAETLEEALVGLWGDVKAWAKARAATGAGRR